MHLLRGNVSHDQSEGEAVDLGQTPGDLVIVSAADTELAALAAALDGLNAEGAACASLRLANMMQLRHPFSVDLYAQDIWAQAKTIVLRVLGGLGYWRYGVEQAQEVAKAKGARLIVLPGDAKPDPELLAYSSADPALVQQVWDYFNQGGPDNMRHLLLALSGQQARPPQPLIEAGGYRLPATDDPRPRLGLVFYRAHFQAGNLAPIDALIAAAADQGLACVPIFAASLKEPRCAAMVSDLLERFGCQAVLNTTAFAIGTPEANSATPFDGLDAPVFQVVLGSSTQEAWQANPQGLSPRDIAMHVSLPEIDGRILTRAVSFKAAPQWHAPSQCALSRYEALPDRAAWVAELAARWIALRNTPAQDKRLALILANYPNRNGRLANGVGLDTPASTCQLVRSLQAAGYDTGQAPQDPEALMQFLGQGATNDLDRNRRDLAGARWPLADYKAAFARLPQALQEAVTQRWGAPEADPFVADQALVLPFHRFGNVVIGIQPARGYNIDPETSYHDPDLVPPHGYLAAYYWLRQGFGAQAIMHVGKHGNLEWLPGKALALSAACWPEAILGPLPHLYPFIVNDPGEGAQAKRRAAAVILDHLTPPLARAESYGELAQLERLVDEYAEASGSDARRAKLLQRDILDLTRALGLDQDMGISDDTPLDEALLRLDNHLCDLKELQIRDGLHIFGQAPSGEQASSLLAALARLPRYDGKGGNQGLTRALAEDLDLDPADFDPLDCAMAEPWSGPRPPALAAIDDQPWRSTGDTVERLEILALALIEQRLPCDPAWSATAAVLETLASVLRPALERSADQELAQSLRALEGRFVPPGPSGAPTRGRPDVLPTGRNFFSIDSRSLPTQAAWRLGQASAAKVVERFVQDHGDWPRRLALSAWGTANMRTGGDDLAQAMALMGVKPVWDANSGRVTGFEIIDLRHLGRPRVDVTLRVSGFFRDAFPAQIALFDQAVQALAALDEPAEQNPLAAALSEARAAGQDARQATYRVFGSKPGAYGAGLQAMIDEKGWQQPEDLAGAYLAWSGYAYGQAIEGAALHETFKQRLAGVQAVLHNQDNREHDLLDSDDYYQFEGGLAVSIQTLSGSKPQVYHNDHSRPERPQVRSLSEEIGRVVRARVVNPKWIAGVMRHGYKGAFEMAATVDYMFAFAATTGAVGHHHFDAVYQAYIEDPAVLAFFEQHNPAALAEMAERLQEAIERGLWRPKWNQAPARLADLSKG